MHFAFAMWVAACLVSSSIGKQLDTAMNNVNSTAPHIIFMFADDLGWNNLGYKQVEHSGSTELRTPTLDGLAASGLQMERLYSYKYCSPTRSSFLSGRLPMHVTQVVQFLISIASPLSS